MKTKINKNIFLLGDNLSTMKKIKDNTIDLIFADPPYNMNLQKKLFRPNGDEFNGVNDEWDKYESLKDYDNQAEKWLKECLRILKPDGSFWVIGSFQNIHRIGYILQDLGAWIINEIVWEKTNPVPNFAGTRFVNSQETLLWVVKRKNAKYTFNYKTMKFLNNGKQMKSVWSFPICSGNERLRNEFGKKVHSTQKPLALLERIILASSNYGDLVLDPFSGTGTTAHAAKKWGRKYIGIELNKDYYNASIERLNNVNENLNNDDLKFAKYDIPPKKILFKDLLDKNIISTSDVITIKEHKLNFNDDATITFQNNKFTPNKLCKKIFNKPTNAWNNIYINGVKISELREKIR